MTDYLICIAAGVLVATPYVVCGYLSLREARKRRSEYLKAVEWRERWEAETAVFNEVMEKGLGPEEAMALKRERLGGD